VLPLDEDPRYAAALRYAAIGIEFGTIVVAGVIAGYYLDQYLGTAPLFSLLLTIGGMIGAVQRLLWTLKKNSTR
jgi:F0F1-type ATP synthase assembly protein I